MYVSVLGCRAARGALLPARAEENAAREGVGVNKKIGLKAAIEMLTAYQAAVFGAQERIAAYGSVSASPKPASNQSDKQYGIGISARRHNSNLYGIFIFDDNSFEGSYAAYERSSRQQ